MDGWKAPAGRNAQHVVSRRIPSMGTHLASVEDRAVVWVARPDSRDLLDAESDVACQRGGSHLLLRAGGAEAHLGTVALVSVQGHRSEGMGE